MQARNLSSSGGSANAHVSTSCDTCSNPAVGAQCLVAAETAEGGLGASKLQPSGAGDAEPIAPLTWMGIVRINWRLCIAVFFLFAVTLSIFPGFLSGVYWVFCAHHLASA
jgi:hypothetical protein